MTESKAWGCPTCGDEGWVQGAGPKGKQVAPGVYCTPAVLVLVGCPTCASKDKAVSDAVQAQREKDAGIALMEQPYLMDAVADCKGPAPYDAAWDRCRIQIARAIREGK